MIWSGNHLGHGCNIDDHTYLSSHICISGHTNIGKRCFIGVNSHFKDFINIGDDVVIGMGSNVNKDIDSGSLVIGSKSEILSKDNLITKKILKSYFNL